ncbi:hypothetical protein INT47_012924 [Mucor saturninus]|uniref:protein-tyrosine-phosphatase n=1 Tax=Mucor saturninus TaxID=64648 RepID=A0A8H7QQ82_9FUNG|nr:hypothetical protein INT47_012924 [Mucor saturninus]
MIFDRYRSKSKTRPDEEKSSLPKKISLANTLFRKFPIHLSKKKTIKKQVVDHPPRPSLSLPNIPAAIIPLSEPIIKPIKQSPVKQRKRHSAEQRRSRRNHHLKEDVARHSYTFGHLSSTKTLTRADLTIGTDQLERLAKLVHLQDNTDFLLSQLGTQSSHLVPHRSMSHQHLTVNTPVTNNILLFRQNQNLNRAHSESHAKTLIVQEPLEPEELFDLLEEKEAQVILIDVRNLMDYQKKRISNSLNVNLPSLLIKRYQRGTVSNFNLENFITTVEGRELYASTLSPPPPSTATVGSIFEKKAAEAEIKKKQKSKIWVVYDEEMSTEEPTSQAWTLLNVLDRCIGSVGGGKMYYLNGGFKAFQQYQGWIETDDPNLLPSPTPNNTIVNIPRRSISYTIGDSKNDLSKRTSLFSLDTQAARVNNANALARRAKRRSQQQQQQEIVPTSSSSTTIPSISTMHHFTVPTPSLSAISTFPPASFANSGLIRVTEDDEIAGMMTADASPRTESDFCFIISEIIPGFLFVGPEIETSDHASQLDVRSIKRVLNMAEECQDEGLQNQPQFTYHKISARDTLEMKNIEFVMMEAVQFIEEAKKNHEPIYVHCKAGKSRSITAILAYLVTSERWTLKRAYRHVIKARPNMSPNIGFISELMKMDGRVHGRVSSFMETDWQSTSLPSPEYANELFQLERSWQQ